MSDREFEELEDLDLATAAEQSSEEDEAQEGGIHSRSSMLPGVSFTQSGTWALRFA